MNRINNLSIKNKLIVIILVVTTIAMTLGLTIKLLINIENYKTDLVNQSTLEANLIAEFCVAPLMFNQNEAARDILAKLRNIPTVSYGHLLDNEGNIITKYSSNDESIKFPPIPINRTLSKYEDNNLHIYQPVEFDGDKYGTLYLNVSTQSLDKQISNHILISLTIGIGIFLLAFFIASRLQHTISDPILKLAKLTEEISESKYFSTRIEKRRDDEIGTLYNGFNNMLSQIELKDKDLIQSELRYRNLFENAHVPLWVEDFSEVKKSIDQLKQKGVTDFRIYFDENPEMVVDIASHVKILDINNAVLELHEAESKEELLHGLAMIFTEDSMVAFKEELIAIAQDQSVFEFEGVVKTIKGEEKQILLNWSIVPGYEKSLEKIFISTTDITDRKKAEQKLQKQKFYLESAQKIGSIGTWELDVVKNILIWTVESYRIFGVPIGTPDLTYEIFLECVHPEDREYVNKEWLLALESTSYDIEHRLLVDEKVKWVREKADLKFDKEGTCIKAVGVTQDITLRKQVENKLRESEKLYRILAENSTDTIWLMQLDGTFLYHSPAIMQLRGYTPEEANNVSMTKTMTPQSMEYLEKIFIREDKKPMKERWNKIRIELEMLRKDGTKLWTEVSANAVFDENGQMIGLQGSTQDISERKKLEEENIQLEAHLRHQQKLESIGVLAGGVAHEINNPINGIMNYAQLIKDKLVENDPLKEYSREIIIETERVATIVRNLLTFSRDDKETHSFAKMDDILNSTISLIQAVFKQDQISLNVDIPNNLPQLKCRSQQIRQVLMNLMANAKDSLNEKYKSYDENKVMKISVSQFEKENRRWMRVTVEDNGVGISEAIQSKIYDPFFTTKDRATGTGLGLSISYGIVKDHHGKLHFESEVGKFTRFYLDIPIDT